MMRRVPPQNFFAHDTAIIEPNATIGSGTSVWHHAHVRDGAEVGSSCVLGKGVFVDTGVAVGDRCKIQNNVSVYNGVTISDDVFVGPAVTFTNDLVPRAFADTWEITATSVGRGASIGANATIVCGSSLGEFCMVGAGSVVTRDVRPYSLVMGNPARFHAWVCRCGQVISREIDQPDELSCATCVEKQGALS